jgi:hypothetical protein
MSSSKVLFLYYVNIHPTWKLWVMCSLCTLLIWPVTRLFFADARPFGLLDSLGNPLTRKSTSSSSVVSIDLFRQNDLKANVGDNYFVDLFESKLRRMSTLVVSSNKPHDNWSRSRELNLQHLMFAYLRGVAENQFDLTLVSFPLNIQLWTYRKSGVTSIQPRVFFFPQNIATPTYRYVQIFLDLNKGAWIKISAKYLCTRHQVWI